MEYLIILVAVLLISPYVLRLASKQNKKTKTKIKTFYLLVLLGQIILGFLNWEKFGMVGRSGFELAQAYPNSFLWLFFAIPSIQVILLLVAKSLNYLVVVLNFFSSVLIFIAMVKLSNILGFQAVSLASIGTVFLVLTGNVLGLTFINKDKNLLKKYRLL